MIERSYGMTIPGFPADDRRAKRLTVAPGHAGRIAAIRDSGKRR